MIKLSTFHLAGLCITFPNISRGSLELIKTGLTLSPERRPLTGERLSNMPSNFPFSSNCQEMENRLNGKLSLGFLKSALYSPLLPNLSRFRPLKRLIMGC